MAAARCTECGKPKRVRRMRPGDNGPFYYTGPFYPAGGFELNQAIICGKKGCHKRAEEIWLKEEEETRYRNGVRIFDFNTFTGGKIKLQDGQ